MSGKFEHEEAWRGPAYLSKLMMPVAVCGVGAVGSNLLQALARIGFSDLRGIDFDRVEEANVAVQAFGLRDVGAMKATAIQKRIFEETGVEIKAHTKIIEGSTVGKLLRGSYLVVDCLDNVLSRAIVQNHCHAQKYPLIHVGLSNDGFAEVTWEKHYRMPAKPLEGDPCANPMTRNLVMLAVAVAAEEIADFFLAEDPRMASWEITIRDLAIRRKAGSL